MAILNMKKSIFAAVAALALGAASMAQASPTFTVAPGTIGSTTPTFQAQTIIGDSSELLTQTATTDSGDGYISYDSFKFVDPATNQVTKVNLNDFGLYVKFHLQDTRGMGGMNTLNVLDFQMYADPGHDTTFRAAGMDGSGNGVTTLVTANNPDVLLASGSLVNGTAVFLPLGGVGLNANVTFNLAPAGMAFFPAPRPFFDLSFNGFNNPTGAAITNADHTVSVNAGGTTVFANAVPEPASIALLGLGLLGVGVSTRRRKG